MRTVVHYTDSTIFGGAEQALVHLMSGLDSSRWRQVLMCQPAPGNTRLVAAATHLEVPVVVTPPLPLGPAGALRTARMARLIRAQRADVFHAHMTWPLACKYALLASILADTPATLATLQLYVDAPYSGAARWQQRLLSRHIHRFIAVSADTADRLKRNFGISRAKITTIPNTIPTIHSASPLPRDERPVVLTVARLHEQKGIQYLLEAAARIPEAVFMVAGSGPEEPTLAAQARSLGITDRVRFLGHRDDVPDLLATCDVYALPSLYEGLPLSVLEAMAHARPVVATAVGGTCETVVDGSTGLLVPPADPAALASAIRRLITEPALAQRMGKAGHARLQAHFSPNAMVARIEQVYSEALHDR